MEFLSWIFCRRLDGKVLKGQDDRRATGISKLRLKNGVESSQELLNNTIKFGVCRLWWKMRWNHGAIDELICDLILTISCKRKSLLLIQISKNDSLYKLNNLIYYI